MLNTAIPVAVALICPTFLAADSASQFVEEFANRYCLDCHASIEPEREFDIEGLSWAPDTFRRPGLDTEPMERIHRRLSTRQMPPPDSDRPTEREYRQVIESIESLLDEYAVRFPRVAAVDSIRRMTRTEYENAIRDLLGFKVDAAELLPKDESSHGFDNITVANMSPTLMNRYVSAAQKLSRLAVGNVTEGGSGWTIRVPADRSQEGHVSGLPFGSRGGAHFDHYFPKTGHYEFAIKLTRDRDEKVEGLLAKHQIDIFIDRERKQRFEVVPPENKGDWENRDFTHSDSHLKARIRVATGTHRVGVTFPKQSSAIDDNKRQPFQTNFNRHRHPRKTPAVYQVSIVGPFSPDGPDEPASPRTLFDDVTIESGGEDAAARQILGKLARSAYRRPITADDLATPLNFFRQDLERAGFDAGLEAAISAILVNPSFLFRIEPSVTTESETGPQPISNFELATRLSFFIWSSIPDEQLLRVAEESDLHCPDILNAEVERMLSDERADSLVTNFASQWLHLRNLDSITPDLRAFPDFDDNLRQAFRSETEYLFRELLREDRSVLDLIRSDHTYLNHRLAQHYGIGGVHGDHFRRVDLPAGSIRGGLLRHGSFLMVTSYATRTAPTIRGNWILENILGTPAPPPPPNVPALEEQKVMAGLPLRDRLAQHRANEACASCHALMDPVGFALENFDAVGRWRTFADNHDIDSSGTLPDGTEIKCVSELEAGILQRPEVFVRTVCEKLMTFALGRAVQPEDGPAIRSIIKDAASDEYRLSALVKGIVRSQPFRYRLVQGNVAGAN